MPDLVHEIQTPDGLVLAADQKKLSPSKTNFYELEGDLDALQLINLEKEGLNEYKDYVTGLGLVKSPSLASQRSLAASVTNPSRTPQNASRQSSSRSVIGKESIISQRLQRSLSVSSQKTFVSIARTASAAQLSTHTMQKSSTPKLDSYPIKSSLKNSNTTKSIIDFGDALDNFQQPQVSPTASPDPYPAPSRLTTSRSPSASAPSTSSLSSKRTTPATAPQTLSAQSQMANSIIELLFQSIDRNKAGRIRLDDAQKLLLRLNSRLGKHYGEDECRAFFSALDLNKDNTIDLNEFKLTFQNSNME
jgi:hypothetical protein